MPHILIAGAGIGGLTAALTLAKAGHTVTVIERAPTLQEAGAGLQISPNASAVLRRLGLLDGLRSRASAPTGIRVRSARSAATLSVLPLDGAEARWGAPYLVAHRADLLRVLAEAVANTAGITLHLGTALAGFGTTTTGVTITAKQGRLTRTFQSDALVGADGVRSAVRTRLVTNPTDTPMQTGRTAWRALVPREAVDALFGNGETGLWLGRDAHLVHYPLRDGTLVNVVAILRETLEPDLDALWNAPGDPAVIASRFARWHPAARRLIAAAADWRCWPLFDRAPLPAWNAGPIALLGDAAHPILPFLAQGAAQAIEDAEALADALSRPGTIEAGLALYSKARQPRALEVQETARQLGGIYHMAGPLALARDLAMRTMGAHRLMRRYDWVYQSRKPDFRPR